MLRDLYVRGKYRDVILPMAVLRRLDAVLEDGKAAVIEMKETLDAAGIVEQAAMLRQAAGQAFYNTSRFTLSDLRSRANRERLEADFRDYLDGYSPNVQDILDCFEFRNQIPRLSRADALGTLIEKVTSPDVNLGPAPVKNADGSIRHPALDNHGMGSIFEELVRRFNEENNEEAGEHWTPRDAVKLMANLVFLPVADEIDSGTYLLYDGACGTGGMLTVAEEALRELAAERGKEVSTHLFGQEINAETYAICKADLLLKGEGDAADNIVGGPEHPRELGRAECPHRARQGAVAGHDVGDEGRRGTVQAVHGQRRLQALDDRRGVRTGVRAGRCAVTRQRIQLGRRPATCRVRAAIKA